MLKIYGSSDDLIEIEGDIHEEFTALREFDNGDGEDGGFLGLSDGTVLRIEYSNEGIWRIQPIFKGSGEFSIVQGTNDDDDYSDVATVDATIRWAILGSEHRGI